MQEQWPSHLPQLYPDIQGAELCEFLPDQEYERIKQFPLVYIFPFFTSDGEKRINAFGVGLARLMIRDLMLVRNISVHGPEDTPNVPREQAQEYSRIRSYADSICISGELSTQRGFRLQCDLWKNGEKIDQITVFNSDFTSFLLQCAEALTALVGGEITPELRQQWSVSRPLKPSSLARLGLTRLKFHNEESEEKERLAQAAISEDPNFGLLYSQFIGDNKLKTCLKAYQLDPYDARNCFSLYIATWKSVGGYEPYALQFLRKAIELSPGYGKAHMCSPHAAPPSKLARMIRHSELGYLLLPGNSFAVANYSNELKQLGESPEKLIELTKQGIADSPNDPGNYRSLIGFLMDQENFEEALTYARLLQERLYEPEISPRALFCLKQNPQAQALIESGEWDPRQENLDTIQSAEYFVSQNGVLYQSQDTFFRRVLKAVVPLIFLWAALLIGLICWFQFSLLPAWQNGERFDLAMKIATTVTALCFVWKFCWQIYGVVIRLNTVEIKRLIPCSDFAMKDLKCIIGMGGLDLSGGDMILWKRNVLFSDRRSQTVKLNEAENKEFYETLLRRNQDLAGIPFPFKQIDRPELLAQFLPKATWLFRRSAAAKLIIGLIALVVCLGLCYVGTKAEKPELFVNLAPGVIVGFVSALLLMVSSVRDFLASRKLRRKLQNENIAPRAG